MFTGIIEEMGKVEQFEERPNLAVLTLQVNTISPGTKLGESIAVNGVCLSVVKKVGKKLSFDLMKETLASTTLGHIKPGTRVNLERAMRADSRFGGHFVTGHVDGIGRIDKIIQSKNYVEFQITVPKQLMKFIVPKGSVCVDGISLTVGKVKGNQFSVYLIPVTLKVTTFGLKEKGDRVNIETDILARYILQG